MDLTPAIACAAFLMGQSVPEVTVFASAEPISLQSCANAGRPEGCSGVEGGVYATGTHPAAMSVRIQPESANDWPRLVHAGCHVVLIGNGLPYSGKGPEAMCEALEMHAHRCR